MACAAAEVFMDFNSGEKTEAVSAATLLYHGWDASRVREESPVAHRASTNHLTGNGRIPPARCPRVLPVPRQRPPRLHTRALRKLREQMRVLLSSNLLRRAPQQCHVPQVRQDHAHIRPNGRPESGRAGAEQEAQAGTVKLLVYSDIDRLPGKLHRRRRPARGCRVPLREMRQYAAESLEATADSKTTYHLMHAAQGLFSLLHCIHL